MKQLSNLDLNNNKIVNLADPSTDQEAATKAYVDGALESVGSSEHNTVVINQTSHGFSIGNVLYFNGTAFALAQADDLETAEVVGIVMLVNDVNNFTLLTDGIISNLSGLTAGEIYFLSDSTPGALTTTAPTTPNYVSKPLLLATATDTGLFKNWRGTLIPTSSPGNVIELIPDINNEVIIDASLGNHFRFTEEDTSNVEITDIINGYDGQKIIIEIKQNGTGTRTLTVGPDFSFGEDIPNITLSSLNNVTDYISLISRNSNGNRWAVVGISRGFPQFFV